MYIVYFIVYGFLLTAAIGLLASWIDRKVTARVQYRVGPPLLQPIIDIVKLFGKETLIPVNASRAVFFGAPMIGFASVALVSTLLWMNVLDKGWMFLGDAIVALYLFTIPSLCIIMGGFASRNIYASIGSSREMKLVLSYELPFVMALLVPIIKSGFSLRLSELLSYQAAHGVFIASPSGIIAFIVAILVIQAKLGFVPFDVAEAETEIVGGPFVDYSGALLGTWRLMKNMMFFALPFFIMVMFTGGLRFDGIHFIYGVLKYVGIVALITVIRNTNPRVRIDQAMRFFWGPVTLLAVTAIVLAFRGL